MKTLKDIIVSLLENNEKYVKLVDDKKQVNFFTVKKDIINMDKDLLSILFNDNATKEAFFINIDNNYIFNKEKILEVLNTRLLDDSYTKYKNKVGLIDENGNFISDSNEIVLSYPYKDCILEGGQEKETDNDGKKIKRKEKFYNPLIAEKETKLMMAPKVFINAKRYTKDGVEENIENFNDDNLIIKGNNLLALSSLLKRYEGKIKLIYIDPPYNTGTDDFTYNDNFNHSAWLVFIKNRLEIAKRLLRPDGIIMVNIDDNEEPYLYVLMNEIFENQSRFDKIALKTSSSQGGFGDVNPGLISNTEYILTYVNDINYKKNCWTNENMYIPKKYDENYKYIFTNIEKLEYVNINELAYEKLGISKPYNNSTWRKLKEKFGNSYKNRLYDAKEEIANENKDKVFRTYNPNKPTINLKNKLTESKNHKNKIIIDIDTNGDKRYILNGEVVLFYSDMFRMYEGVLQPTQKLNTFWDDISYEGISNEGGITLRNAKKPEMLMKRIISICTKPNDFILDFFAGSGTTGAVAHKMGRKYIMCEQLETHINLEIERMKNVINGDQTGVSKQVNFAGGGPFVYCELAKNNQQLIEDIEKAEDDNKLNEILEIINKTQYINVKVRIKDVIDNKKEFDELTFEEKKKFLIELLDKNQLYVNYDDIDDEEFKISDSDKKFTKSFYNVKE